MPSRIRAARSAYRTSRAGGAGRLRSGAAAARAMIRGGRTARAYM